MRSPGSPPAIRGIEVTDMIDIQDHIRNRGTLNLFDRLILDLDIDVTVGDCRDTFILDLPPSVIVKKIDASWRETI